MPTSTDTAAARPLTLRRAEWAHAGTMLTIDYARSTGRCLTYRIRADDWGTFAVFLGDKELLRGRDPLCAHGRHRLPNKRKAAGAVHHAKEAIESLREMTEE